MFFSYTIFRTQFVFCSLQLSHAIQKVALIRLQKVQYAHADMSATFLVLEITAVLTDWVITWPYGRNNISKSLFLRIIRSFDRMVFSPVHSGTHTIIGLMSANILNFDSSKILFFGKGLNNTQIFYNFK